VTNVIGVDLGGTKIAVAELSDSSLSDSSLEPTELSSQEALIDQLVRIIDEHRGDQLDGVGVGVPSVVEFDSGRVVSSANVPLTDVPLREVLGERVGVPVFVDNDATVAALAEAHDEDLNLVSRNLVIITVGTGVGGGVVIDGRIFRGGSGGAGELGMTLIGLVCTPDIQAATQHFPQPGSLEALASGTALDRFGMDAAVEHPNSVLGRRLVDREPVLGPDVVAAARGGDAPALEALSRWAHALGVGIANAINTFDPDEVVIGGGGASAGDLLLAPAREFAAGYVHPGLQGRAQVRIARWGVTAGVLGAALLAAHELERVPT
jgi:glucokinase